MIRANRKVTGTDLRNQIKRKNKADAEPQEKEKDIWFPGGSALFNLACSDRHYGAYKAGTMINIVGDSSSGKSILVLSGMAAVANNPKFDDYRLIYDDAEFADSFDHKKLFGTKFKDRVEAPGETASTTIEQFFDHIMDAVDAGKPFIYCLDSFDAIDADDEIKKEYDNREHRKAGNLSKIKGSFQATKQKKASQMFRQICGKLKETKSLLIIISQTRDNLSGMGFSTKYRAGGKALKFYASIEAWLANKGSIKKTYQGNTHKIGVQSIIKIEKNKFTGKRKEAEISIYHDYGVDDIEACIEYLIKNKFWVQKGNTIHAEGLHVEMTKNKLIQFIEEKGKERVLFSLTQQCWKETEEALKLNRKEKFE
jgi:RecA/RadA recombinase